MKEIFKEKTSVSTFIYSILALLLFYMIINRKSFSLKKVFVKNKGKVEPKPVACLNVPLSELVRPKTLEDIVGQDDAKKALMAVLCGPNPQHVILYGPPGVGKTALARLITQRAKESAGTPFQMNAPFIEVDATTVRFDERGIADPLLGCVHDPIYQGAGKLGVSGIPQPKPGAVTKANGGVLFIDEIGELHPAQMNRLLKVLEDRRVMFESSYYDPEDTNVPHDIHEAFEKGFPADFRLIGATTRSPNEISPALRSRCMEIFLKQLTEEELREIAIKALEHVEKSAGEEAMRLVAQYAQSGREAVNIVQMAAGICSNESREEITVEDVIWVGQSGQYSLKVERKATGKSEVGVVSGFGVYGANLGVLTELEATATFRERGMGSFNITGVVDEEEFKSDSRNTKRKSMIKSSAENVSTVLKSRYGMKLEDYDIHLNFPGGALVDGPSAGMAMAVVIYSAINGIAISDKVAFTGEVSIRGMIKPVGGIRPKVEAAKRAEISQIFIPRDNLSADITGETGIDIFPVDNLDEVMTAVFGTSVLNNTPRASFEREQIAGVEIAAAATNDGERELTI